MKHLIITAALASSLAAPALAADLPARVPVKAPVVAMPVAYNWSGFYIGGHVGGIWGDKDWTVTSSIQTPFTVGAAGGHDLSSWLGGGQIGFNVQSGQFVFGIEAQASWTDADGSFGCVTVVAVTCKTELNWVGTVAGRLGIAWDRVLIYVKGGGAFVDEDYTVTAIAPAIAVSSSHSRTGWMVGGGIEFALASNWSAKVEYNYMDFGNKSVTFTDGAGGTVAVDIDQVLHVVKFGINYRFGGGAVIARY